jgi:transcriptional regulator with XRE-family HTH domain
MLAQWTADLVGQMHKFKITKSRLADHMGMTREYVSMVLNGHREPADAEERFKAALAEIIEEVSAAQECGAS